MADRPITRRRALAGAGGLVLGLSAAACSDGSAPAEEAAATTATTATTGTSTTTTAPACVLTPEQTEGPYYIDLDRVRADITEGRPGTRLRLRVQVVDAGACTPLRDAAVDVWHCDALGEYSGIDDSGTTFLRGVQMTGADGVAELRTVYPGWYRGRTVHVHVKVHLGGSEAHTGQLYFDDAVTDAVYQAEPYSGRPDRGTRNADDGLFSQGGDSTLLDMARDGDGYVGAVTLGVRRT